MRKVLRRGAVLGCVGPDLLHVGSDLGDDSSDSNALSDFEFGNRVVDLGQFSFGRVDLQRDDWIRSGRGNDSDFSDLQDLPVQVDVPSL